MFTTCRELSSPCYDRKRPTGSGWGFLRRDEARRADFYFAQWTPKRIPRSLSSTCRILGFAGTVQFYAASITLCVLYRWIAVDVLCTRACTPICRSR